MALLGSAMTTEVGLRLLLSPLSSNVVIRTACCSVGIAYPVYSTFKAIENKDQNEQQRWLLYWAAYGSFSLVEVLSDKILSWFPFYYYAKFTFLVWLQLPSGNGSRHLYERHLRPFLLRHQARLDQIASAVSVEMDKFMSTHQDEIQILKTLFCRFIIAANQMVRGVIQPGQPQERSRIERPSTNPTMQIGDSNPDHEE
ncbi:HVA22-like protein k [Acorus gramineus]|uniref:HVA22-like protein n=1 Tax=Acorus gramineus TaxID=55184 RepID=A0AAV9AUR7_ACOGR|nr:HVA22-like protein k [Acorus gramineus]